MESDKQLLYRVGTSVLKKAAKRQDYLNALWTHKVSVLGDKYRITKRIGKHVYILWNAFGYTPPRGTSLKYTIGEFLRLFKVVE